MVGCGTGAHLTTARLLFFLLFFLLFLFLVFLVLVLVLVCACLYVCVSVCVRVCVCACEGRSLLVVLPTEHERTRATRLTSAPSPASTDLHKLRRAWQAETPMYSCGL